MSAEPLAPTQSVLLHGVILKLLSTFAFTLMSAMIKLLGPSYPIGELVFFRSLFAMVPIYIWLAWRHDLGAATRTNNFLAHIRRGCIGSLGMFAGFAALSFLPLSDATAIGYAAPLITVVLAAFVLGETVRFYRWSAVGIGFVGVLVMLYPYLAKGALLSGMMDGGPAKGAALGLLGAGCAALATIEVRRLTASENTAAIVFYFSLLSTIVGASSLAAGWFHSDWAWQMPSTPRDGAVAVAVGLLGGLGQILMTQSFRHADASVIASFDYMSMIWAVVIGYLLFGDLPAGAVVGGAAIVIMAGIFVIWRERRLGIHRVKQRRAANPRSL